jgi:hypothetical protein
VSVKQVKDQAMKGSGFLRALPFLSFAIAAYLMGVTVLGLSLDGVLAALPLPSGAVLRVTFGALVLLAALVLFFVELLISTRPTKSSLINHGLSMALFVLCIVLFLLLPACGTAEFLLLTVLSLIDVVSGYSISIITARRDMTLEREL